VRASQVQLALIALTTTDLLVARAVLDPVDAGNYALGSIATKVAFWLPAAVATVLFPQMADPASHARARRLALTVVGGVGLALCLGAFAVTPVVPIVVGEDYAPVAGWLWLFTALGALQIGDPGAAARGHRRAPHTRGGRRLDRRGASRGGAASRRYRGRGRRRARCAVGDDVGLVDRSFARGDGSRGRVRLAAILRLPRLK
jgi:hypothetical protein